VALSGRACWLVWGSGEPALAAQNARQAILQSLEGTHKYPAHEFGDAGHGLHRDEDEALTASISTQRGR
jgi:phospholipid/cholesterol/gamma-HCH transport system ATP-binding protein